MAARAENGGDLQALSGQSECLLKMGRYRDVLDLLSDTLAAPVAPDWAPLNAASAAERSHNRDVALRYLERLAAQSPKLGQVHYRLSRLYAVTSPERSKAELQRFLILKNENEAKP